MMTVARAQDAGWYPDPHDGSRVRWLDGRAWTDRTRTTPPAPFTWETGSAIAPTAPTPFAVPTARAPAASASTVWIWLLAFGLYLWGVPAGLIDGIWLSLVPEAQRDITIGLVAFVVSMVVGLVPLWVFAGLDIRALGARRLPAPSILWMLLLPPLGYFLARRSALKGTGARWRGPQLALAIIVGSQLMSAIVGLVLGGGALLALVATAPGTVGAPSPGTSSEYGYNLGTQQENAAGYLIDGGGDYGAQVERLLASAYNVTADRGDVDCSASGVLAIASATFPCDVVFYDAARLTVSVTIGDDGAVTYTQLP